MTSPRIAIGPEREGFAVDAVTAGGGRPADADSPADGLVWLAPSDTASLRRAVEATGAGWVQLSAAGVERAAAAGLFDADRTWTSAKGLYAEPVAEHALMLALAGMRLLRERVTATTWGRAAGESLYDQPVTILGGGGITASLLGLLAPFRVTATVVRRTAEPVPGAVRTLATGDLMSALPGARVVFLALALTPGTERIIGAGQLAAMGPGCWLINVARGRHVDTAALVTALDNGVIAGAGLDVTDPEPLPDGHPLWTQPRCIITPHTADTPEMTTGPLARRIRDNVANLAAGRPLEGRIDPAAGY